MNGAEDRGVNGLCNHRHHLSPPHAPTACWTATSERHVLLRQAEPDGGRDEPSEQPSNGTASMEPNLRGGGVAARLGTFLEIR